MSRTDWPKLCTLADCSRLFAEEGLQVHRSNISRFVTSRGIQKTAGKVDPNALFDAMKADYSREVMAGRTAAPASAPSPPPGDDDPLVRDDPKRELTRIQVQQAQLKLDAELANTAPIEEVAAAIAEALADLRSTGLRLARDEAARLLADVGAPAHKIGVVIAALKRYLNALQEAFAASAAGILEPSSTPETPARARLDALVALDLDLRGKGEGHEPDPALAEPET